MHLLSNAPELIDISLEILMTLGGRSGRDGDKLGGFRTKVGVTGSPILLDALTYVEGRVVASMDTGESTVYVADVVAAERLNGGGRLGIGEAWQKLPPQWIIDYEAGHEAQIEDSRRRRGLPSPH
jgi:flavin reductase (DIM6/NTAB) family NADH-FMN oxidoreductase RutF